MLPLYRYLFKTDNFKHANKFEIEPKQLYTVTSDNGAHILKAINLVKKDISTALNESHSGQDDANLNDTADIHSNLSSSDDECSDK